MSVIGLIGHNQSPRGNATEEAGQKINDGKSGEIRKSDQSPRGGTGNIDTKFSG